MRRRAFSFIEVLIALAILGVAIAALYLTFHSGLLEAKISEDRVKALAIAQKEIEWVKQMAALGRNSLNDFWGDSSKRTKSYIVDGIYQVHVEIDPNKEVTVGSSTAEVGQCTVSVIWKRPGRAREQELFAKLQEFGAADATLKDMVNTVVSGVERRRYYHFTTPGPRASLDDEGNGPVLADKNTYIENLQLMHDFYTQGAKVACCTKCNWQGWPNTTRNGMCPSCGAPTTMKTVHEPPNHKTTRSYQKGTADLYARKRIHGQGRTERRGNFPYNGKRASRAASPVKQRS